MSLRCSRSGSIPRSWCSRSRAAQARSRRLGTDHPRTCCPRRRQSPSSSSRTTSTHHYRRPAAREQPTHQAHPIRCHHRHPCRLHCPPHHQQARPHPSGSRIHGAYRGSDGTTTDFYDCVGETGGGGSDHAAPSAQGEDVCDGGANSMAMPCPLYASVSLYAFCPVRCPHLPHAGGRTAR